MTQVRLSRELSNHILDLVRLYRENEHHFRHVAQTVHNCLLDDAILMDAVHSLKYRTKEADHLKDKLRRKAHEAVISGRPFDIDRKNLFRRITDLAGVRILHLYTGQAATIIPRVLKILSEQQYEIVESPFAYTWDEETKGVFEGLGITTEFRPELYTSVHLVTEFNKKNEWCCEIQIRTLTEELWGEVSHMINYPAQTQSIACKEQLKTLARIASGGTRLVDSIVRSEREFASWQTRLKSARTTR